MERWYWVELIGFDADAEDFGTEAFLSRNVSTTGVSLLFAHADFLFEQQDEVLSPTACSYGGHEYNRERRRQQWTKAKLRGLVAALQARGVKVFFSCFDMVEHITDTRYLCYTASGEPAPLRRNCKDHRPRFPTTRLTASAKPHFARIHDMKRKKAACISRLFCYSASSIRNLKTISGYPLNSSWP